MASAGNSKTIPTKSGPQKFTSSAKKRVPSVNIEEVVDIDIRVPSNPPQNPKHVLESEDEDDDNEDDDDRDRDEADTIEIIEESDEDDELKLSQYHFYIQVTNKHLRRPSNLVQEMDFAYLCVLQENSTN
jgi:hypothetical protein